jgi:hypothetical protein
MFTKLKKPPTALDKEIDRVLNKLSTLSVDGEEYKKLLEQVVKLHKMKTEEKPSGVSNDAMLQAATSLTGILLVINYERIHVISTKAMNFIKLK